MAGISYMRRCRACIGASRSPSGWPCWRWDGGRGSGGWSGRWWSWRCRGGSLGCARSRRRQWAGPDFLGGSRHRARAHHRRDLLRQERAGSVAGGARSARPSSARFVPLTALMAQTPDSLAQLRHDLANPLAAILAEAQLLLLTPAKFDTATVASLKQTEDLARQMRPSLQSPGA